MGPSDIAGATGLKEGVVRQRLLGMLEDGEVLKPSRGLYATAPP